jgi:hypothetical protein
MKKSTLEVYLKINNLEKEDEKYDIRENSVFIKENYEEKIFSFSKIINEENMRPIFERYFELNFNRLNIGLECCFFNYGTPSCDKKSIFFGNQETIGVSQILLFYLFRLKSEDKNDFLTIKIFEVFKEKVKDLLDTNKVVVLRENQGKVMMNLIEVEIDKVEEVW